VRLLALSVALVVSGCGDTENGGGGATASGVTFVRIDDEILKPSCTFACHSGGEFAAGGLDLEIEPLAALVDQDATAVACVGGGKRVVPFEPEASLLYLKVAAKLHGDAAPCGDVMPPGPDVPALAEEQVEMVREWIEAGALE
jgi:hypothetical protein